MHILWQSLLLGLSFAFVFVWQKTPLSQYTIQTLGILILAYFFIAFRKKGGAGISIDIDNPWGVFILNTVLLLLVLATGNFSSPVFFLMYFLGFGITFAFRPVTIVVFILGVIALFLPLALRDDVFRNLIMLGSLILFSPLAFFFGKGYKDNKK